MKRFFSIDAPVIRFLAKVGNLITLSIFWTVCSLPLVTLGASSTALYRACFDLREDKGNPVKSFFGSFVRDFKLGTLCWLCIVGACLAVFLFTRLVGALGIGLLVNLAIAIVFFAAIIIWLTWVCVFPLVAYFDNSLKKTLRNAIFIGVKHKKQATVSALLAIVPLALFLFSPYLFLVSAGFWFLLFPGVCAYFITCRFANIFAEYGKRREEALVEQEKETNKEEM